MLRSTGVIEDLNERYPDGWVFQGDGASPHPAKTTNEALAQMVPATTATPTPTPTPTATAPFIWLAHSAHLNPFQQLSAELKCLIDDLDSTNLDELFEPTNIAWGKIRMDHVNRTVENFRKRLRGSIALKRCPREGLGRAISSDLRQFLWRRVLQ
jgi:hypothetical protein